MTLRSPTADEIRDIGRKLDLDLTDEEVSEYRDLVVGTIGQFEIVDEYDAPSPKRTTGDRSSGTRATSGDPLNAWITRCNVQGADDGPLSGLDVGVKDNVAVAGIEMTCGSRVVEGYTPPVDATVVSRLLDAGARIVGKTNMDDMALTGNGHSSAFGPTLNPVDDEYLAGGSSGGSAIAVATGDVDLAIGADQGGSIRIPASWSGVVGLKPTYGLVPYTGIVGLGNPLDSVGPMASNVETVARALSSLAGVDEFDPRQPATVPVATYEETLQGDAAGLSIGVLEEGFERETSEPGIDDTVRDVLSALETAGATVEPVSVPIHTDAQAIYTTAFAEGLLAAFLGEGLGHNWRGWYDTNWVESFGKFRRAQGGDFAPSVKLCLLAGAYMRDQYHSRFYARAMNLQRKLQTDYDTALRDYDVLAMPTTPQTANRYVPDQDRFEFIADAWVSVANTCPFNLTTHPAVSVPAGRSDGLPVGLMFVAEPFEDAKVLDAARAVERFG